jgi:hypothetical protein
VHFALVDLDVGFLREAFAADVALVGLVRQVDDLMLGEVVAFPECFAAHSTLVLLGPRVGFEVSGEVLFDLEARPTHITHMVLLLRMSRQVRLQTLNKENGSVKVLFIAYIILSNKHLYFHVQG